MREHPRRVAAAAGALLAVLVAAWWSGSPRNTPAPSPIARAGTSAQTHDFRAPFAVLFAGQSPLPASKGDELCGYGPVPVVDGIPQIPPEIETAAPSALGNLAADLAARSSERDRAMGMYLQIVAAGSAAGEASRRAHGDCADDDKACQSAADQAVVSATAESRRALVRLATTTSDPDAYALATYSCRSLPGESASDDCALLSSAQWARIEPDNAVPWLYAAADAQRRHDRSTIEAALYRASQARYSDPHRDQVIRVFASDAVAAQPPAVQTQLALSLIGIHAALTFSGSGVVLTQYCSVAALADPSRVQTCGDLAATLIEHGRTEVEVWIGAKVAERIGTTDPRFSTLLDEADALKWQRSQWLKSMQEHEHGLLSCDSLQVLRRNAGAQAQFGESGRLRQELAASGVTTSQAAERWRAERRALLQKNASLAPAK